MLVFAYVLLAWCCLDFDLGNLLELGLAIFASDLPFPFWCGILDLPLGERRQVPLSLWFLSGPAYSLGGAVPLL